MIVVICILIGVISILAIQLYEDGFGIGTFGWPFFGGVLGLLVGFLILLLGNVAYTPDYDNSSVIMDEKTELIALKDNMGIQGNGFLFSTYVDDDLKYVYIVEDENMGMYTRKVDADYAYIKYVEEDVNPYIQKWHWKHNNKVLHWLFSLESTRYTIYLPEGSVIENVYKVDLE